MSEGALRLIQRTAIVDESTTIYATGGAATNPRGLEEVQISASRENLPDNRHTTARKSNYVSHVGAKQASVSFRVPVHNSIVGDLGPVFKSALGSVSANTTLTFSSASTNASVTTSSGSADPVLLLTAGGVKQLRPIKTSVTNTHTLAIKATGSITACQNMATNNGAAYIWAPTADTNYWAFQGDRDSETDEVPFHLQGGVTTKLDLSLDLAQRLGFTIEGTFGDWTQEAGSSLDNPDGALSGHLVGLCGDAFIQDTGTPAAGTQLDVHSLTIDLAPEWVERMAMRTPTATNPGSARVGMKQGRFAVGGLTVVLTKASTAWLAARSARTPYGAFFSWSLGTPGGSTTDDKMAVWLPRVVLNEDPTYPDIGGLDGIELKFTIEEDPDLASPYNVPVLAFSSAA